MKLQRLLIFFSCLFIFSTHLTASIDLEKRSQDFVLETKKIEIPGHPHAFNPSIVRWQGSLLMSFREIPIWSPTDPCGPNSSSFTQIGLVWLDEDLNPIGSPQILSPEFPVIASTRFSRSEDARLVTIGECLYIVNSDNKDRIVKEGGFRMYYAQVDFDGEKFLLHNADRLIHFEGENPHRREKNWAPFDYYGNMLLSYSLSPHRVLRPIFGTGECETFAQSQESIDWNWGELRGGTPALKLNEDQYLAFFHSCMNMATSHSDEKSILHYFIGAYTFSSEPPFEIQQISPEPIVAKGFYNGITYKPYWKPVRVVFPCGYVQDNDYIWLSYGRQDHEMWVAKLDKRALLDSLVPVSSKE